MGIFVKVGRASEGAPLVITDNGIVAYGSAGGTNGGPAGALGAGRIEVDVTPGGAGPGLVVTGIVLVVELE